MSKRQPLRFTAVHEAGHAVADVLLGHRLVHVTIMPNADAGTLGHAKAKAAPSLFAAEGWSYAPAYLLRRMMVAVWAGPLAEMRAREAAGCPACYEDMGVNAGGGSMDGDDPTITDLAIALESCFGVEAERERGRWHATQLLDAAWPAVESVTAALLQQGTLSSREVRSHVRGALGTIPRRSLAGWEKPRTPLEHAQVLLSRAGRMVIHSIAEASVWVNATGPSRFAPAPRWRRLPLPRLIAIANTHQPRAVLAITALAEAVEPIRASVLAVARADDREARHQAWISHKMLLARWQRAYTRAHSALTATAIAATPLAEAPPYRQPERRKGRQG